MKSEQITAFNQALELNGQLLKRAKAELETHKTDAEKAASVRPQVIAALKEAGVWDESTADTVVEKMASVHGLHEIVYHLATSLKQAADRSRQASDLGQPDRVPNKQANDSATDSLKNMHLGRPTRAKKASDLAYEAILDGKSIEDVLS